MNEQNQTTVSGIPCDNDILITEAWFRQVSREFCPIASMFAGKPITYVEIGCWAGASAEWVCRNVLTHPSCRGVGIDPYPEDRRRHNVPLVKEVAAKRVAATGVKWEWIYETSHTALKHHLGIALRDNPIDLFYIDGDHSAPAVVTDFALAWPHMRVGTVVIFDDYGLGRSGRGLPHVKEAYEAITHAWGGKVELLKLGRRQASLRVVSQ